MYPQLLKFKTPAFLQGILPEYIVLYSYGAMIAIGVIVSFFLGLRLTKKYGMDSDKMSSFFLWVILAAFVGGKLFFYFEDIGRYIADPGAMFRSAGGGFVFYGSLIFVVPTMIWWLRKNKIPVRPFFDEIAIVGPVMHSFGRVGCFLAGCCHGVECHNWMGVSYDHPLTKAEPMHTPLYPTQLFDIGINIIILVVVLALRKHKKFQGQLFLVYMILYAIGRSINEIFRGDEARGYVIDGVLSHSQFIAILLLAATVWVWTRWRKTESKLW